MQCYGRVLSRRGPTHVARCGEPRSAKRRDFGRCAYLPSVFRRHHGVRERSSLNVVVVNGGRLLSSGPTSRRGGQVPPARDDSFGEYSIKYQPLFASCMLQ